MIEVSLSLWLPIGRANFYSVTANGWLMNGRDGQERPCSSRQLVDATYVPILQCSVLRRVLEVMPRSFGYEQEGICLMANPDEEAEERLRPVRVTVTLNDLSPGAAGEPRARANIKFAETRITQIRMSVDEHGNYTFTASLPEGSGDAEKKAALEALRAHVGEVFGGNYSIQRLQEQRRTDLREGGVAVRRYNGLTDRPVIPNPTLEDLHKDVLSPPLGVLTFFQLNTLAEGLYNDTLWPAVFFERREFVQEYLKRTDTAVTVLHDICSVVDQLQIDVDATDVEGQVAVLRHFLAVTARESLQKVKWSVESVRRSLLDEMMSVLHRQSRLIQLDLGAILREQTPELALEASESQLRGYVMLAAAKLPLFSNVYEIANLAADYLDIHHGKDANSPVAGKVFNLKRQIMHWKLLLDGLTSNVKSLESAVEQAWMERLLYEQKQSRSEQEAMAEIERSRYGRPGRRSAGRVAYDGVNLLVAVLSVLFVVATTKSEDFKDMSHWWRLLPRLWPIAVIAFVFYLILPGISFLRHWRKDWMGSTDNHTYEFAFLLDEVADREKIKAQLAKRGQVRVNVDKLIGKSTSLAKPKLRRLRLTNLGGGRIERISADNEAVKLHSVIAFRVGPFKHARFEVVNEILANKISDEPRFLLHQIRMFGDSPVALSANLILRLVDIVCKQVAEPMAADGKLDDPVALVRTFYQ